MPSNSPANMSTLPVFSKAACTTPTGESSLYSHIPARLGLKLHRLTVQADGKTRPYKVWGHIGKARDFLIPQPEADYTPVADVGTVEILQEYSVYLHEQVVSPLALGVGFT